MLEELEVTMQSSIDVLSTFNQEKIQLATNPTPATAITLEKKSANHVIKVTYMRNSSIPKTCYEFRRAAQESSCKDTAQMYILKSRIQTYEHEQTDAMDAVITQAEIINKIVLDAYRMMTKPSKSFQTSPLMPINPRSCHCRD